MARAPFVISGIVAADGLLWAVVLVATPAPFAVLAAATLAVGFLLFTIVACAGILLVHAPWARYVGLTTALGGLAVAITGELDAPRLLGILAAGATIVGLTGPWLRIWLRRRPSADGPGPVPTALTLGSLTLVPLAGIVAPSGPSAALLLLALLGLLLAWGYGRASLPALWGLRIALPVLGVLAAWTTGLPGAIPLLVALAVLTGLAWRGAARAVVGATRRPVTPPSPHREPRT